MGYQEMKDGKNSVDGSPCDNMLPSAPAKSDQTNVIQHLLITPVSKGLWRSVTYKSTWKHVDMQDGTQSFLSHY